MRISDWSSDVCSSDLPACWVRRRTKDEQFMADGEFDWLPGAGGAAWTLREAAPCDACVTRYDQEHFLTYARLIDAERFGIDRREAASEILLCNVEQDRSEEHTSELQSLMSTSYA